MKPLRRFDPFQEGMRVDHIWIDTKSRDDIPRLLRSVRDLYLNEELRDAVFGLLEAGVAGDGRGRSADPEMSLWTILVLSLLKRRLGWPAASSTEENREEQNTPKKSPLAYGKLNAARRPQHPDQAIPESWCNDSGIRIRYCDLGFDDHQGRLRHSPSHHDSGKSVSNWRFALWTAYHA